MHPLNDSTSWYGLVYGVLLGQFTEFRIPCGYGSLWSTGNYPKGLAIVSVDKGLAAYVAYGDSIAAVIYSDGPVNGEGEVCLRVDS